MQFKTLILTAALALAISGQAADKKKAAPKKKRKPNAAMAKIKDDPKLPRVLIIGDSISIGYTVPTRSELKGKANLHRPLTNCGPTTKGVQEIDKWLGDGKWDVIHFNWGLHDLKYMGPNGENLYPNEKGGKRQVPPDAYAANLEKLVKRLKKTGAKLIWRNTTPCPPGAKGRYVGDSVLYNKIAAKLMDKHGIPTHDLYTISMNRMKELMKTANVHYTAEGSKVLGQDVARVILKALKK
ncbi:MAG: SGNH/GDSL hydrolase family protein [Limisphaerales bacterium]